MHARGRQLCWNLSVDGLANPGIETVSEVNRLGDPQEHLLRRHNRQCVACGRARVVGPPRRGATHDHRHHHLARSQRCSAHDRKADRNAAGADGRSTSASPRRRCTPTRGLDPAHRLRGVDVRQLVAHIAGQANLFSTALELVRQMRGAKAREGRGQESVDALTAFQVEERQPPRVGGAARRVASGLPARGQGDAAGFPASYAADARRERRPKLKSKPAPWPQKYRYTPLEPGLRQTHRENSAKTLGALLDQVSELGFGIAPARMTAPGPLTPRPRATHLTAVSPDDPNRSTPATSNLAGNIPYCTRFCELRFSSTCRSSPPPFLRVVLGLSACAARSAMRR